MHTYIQTGRQGQIAAARNIQRHKIHTDTYRRRCRQAGRQSDRQTYIQATNHSGRLIGHPYILTCKHTYRQTGRQAGTQTYRHTGRQAYIHTHNHTHRSYIQTYTHIHTSRNTNIPTYTHKYGQAHIQTSIQTYRQSYTHRGECTQTKMQPYIQAGIYTGIHTYIRNAYIHACIHTYTHDINPSMHTHNKIHIHRKACIEADANLFVHNIMCTGGEHAYLKQRAYIHSCVHIYIHAYREYQGGTYTIIPITEHHSHTHIHQLFQTTRKLAGTRAGSTHTHNHAYIQ